MKTAREIDEVEDLENYCDKCLIQLDDGKHAIMNNLPCGHVFHFKCLESFGNRWVCPCCTLPIQKGKQVTIDGKNYSKRSFDGALFKPFPDFIQMKKPLGKIIKNVNYLGQKQLKKLFRGSEAAMIKAPEIMNDSSERIKERDIALSYLINSFCIYNVADHPNALAPFCACTQVAEREKVKKSDTQVT